MDVKYINPFVESVGDLFDSMLSCKATLDTITSADPVVKHQEIIGLIGLSGPIRGTVALIFPIPTVLKAVERFTGLPANTVDSNVTDAVAELVNIVAGGAKARLNGHEAPMTISIPNVIKGMGHTVLAPSWATWIEVAFNSELGPFHLRVTLGK